VKPCRKLPEPSTLIVYRTAQPESTWEEMKDDPWHGGQLSYVDVKRTLVRGQRCLCAYCEIRIARGPSDPELQASTRDQRVEHFHPKADLNRPPNWALHWPNLWAVCLGGDRRPPAGEPFDPERYLPPLPDNLSCDAFKDHQIKAGKLNASPEGWMLAPNELPAFPGLFQFAPDGTPEPCPENCAAHIVLNNRYPDTATLVSRTIEHLNLGCARLNRSRCIAKARLEKMIEGFRENSRGANPQQLRLQLARRLFSNDVSTPWPEFFTLIRWRLGEPAEEHLHAIAFVD